MRRRMARQRLGVRWPSTAFSPRGWRHESGRGLPQSKTSRTFVCRLRSAGLPTRRIRRSALRRHRIPRLTAKYTNYAKKVLTGITLIGANGISEFGLIREIRVKPVSVRGSRISRGSRFQPSAPVNTAASWSAVALHRFSPAWLATRKRQRAAALQDLADFCSPHLPQRAGSGDGAPQAWNSKFNREIHELREKGFDTNGANCREWGF
jgi:hypothetical protein